MTLYPEVALAAELGIDTVALCLVTDVDSGESAEDAVTAEVVFARLAEARPRLLSAIERIVAAVPPDYVAASCSIDDAIVAGSRTVVPMSPAAGHRGRGIHRLARRRGTAARAGTCGSSTRADARRARTRRRRCRPVSSSCVVTSPTRDALDACLSGVDVVSHQAAKVGMGVDFADAPDYVRGERARHRGAARRDGHVPESRRLVLASSMVVYGEGRYVGPGRRRPTRPPRRIDDLRAGHVRAARPRHGQHPGARVHRRGRAARSAQRLRRDQARAGAPRRGLGGRDRRHGVAHAPLPQRVRPGHAARHPVCRASRRSSARRSSAARRRGCSRTAASDATSSTSTTSRGEPRGAIDWTARRRAGRRRGVQRRLRNGLDDPRGGARSSVAAHGGPEPVVTGRVPRGRRASHHRVVRARSRRTGLGAADRPRATGCASSRRRRCATDLRRTTSRAHRPRGRIRSKRHPPGTLRTVTSP